MFAVMFAQEDVMSL